MTQEAAAEALGFARTTLVAIEGGKRQVTPQELRALGKLYGVPETELLDEDHPDIQMAVDFRTASHSVLAEDEARVASLLHRLAANTIEIERLVEQRPPRLDLPEVSISPAGSLDQQAEDAAMALRSRLGIGLGPIQDLTALLEFELGLRVFERPLPSKVGGAVAFDDAAGGFVLLNSLHPSSRRRVTAGHELAHLLVRKHGLSIVFDDAEQKGRDERFFDLFGVTLLTPAAAVRRQAVELQRIFGSFTVRQLLTMAVFFNVPVEAMTRRMIRLGFLSEGAYEQLRTKRIGLDHRDRAVAEMPEAEQPPAFTPRALLMAGMAHQRGLLSEQQIASMLELDLVSVRKALDEGVGRVNERALELAL